MFKIRSIETLGILFAICAYLSFSLLDVIQKTAVITHSIFQILAVKYFFCILLSIIESKRKNNFNFYSSNNFKIQFFRCFLSILESGCFVLAFRYLSLTDVHSIGSLTPVIVVALSAVFLQEKVSLKIWIAIFIGFLGVLIIMRPGLSIFNPYSIIPLFGAFFLGLYQIVTRKTSMFDSNETMLFYNGVIGFIIMLLFAFFNWQSLHLNSFVLLTSVGIFYSLGLYLQIIALSKARASIIQPFHYTLIFWAIIFGLFFYKDVPDLFTIIGALIIVFSGIYVLRQKN